MTKAEHLRVQRLPPELRAEPAHPRVLRRAPVQRIPEDRRAPLYDRGMLTLAESCGGPGATPIAGFCRHQAELLVQLPECLDECLALARRHLPHATR